MIETNHNRSIQLVKPTIADEMRPEAQRLASLIPRTGQGQIREEDVKRIAVTLVAMMHQS